MEKRIEVDHITTIEETSDYITTAYGSLPYYKCVKCGYDELLDNKNYCSNCGRKIID